MYKKFFKYGFVIGFAVGVVVGLSMDLILGNAIGGGWFDAVKNDISKFFGPEYAQNNLYVYLGVACSIALIGLFGGIFTGTLGLVMAALLTIAQRKTHI